MQGRKINHAGGKRESDTCYKKILKDVENGRENVFVKHVKTMYITQHACRLLLKSCAVTFSSRVFVCFTSDLSDLGIM